MLNANIGGFLAVAMITVVTPGPDMLLMARHTLGTGRTAGLATGYGVCAGLIVHAAAAALGVSAILASSAAAFTAVKVLGALYLVYLGVTGARNALFSFDESPLRDDTTAGTNGQKFRQGMLTNVFNPKVALLFLSVLPQFVDRTEAVLAQTALLSGIFFAIALAWITLYVNVLALAGTQILTTTVRRWIQGVSGLVLVALGVRLLVTATD